ncbi:MAG: DNA-formamidopyrimidine glycosylase family protein [Myxococcota bacterium]
MPEGDTVHKIAARFRTTLEGERLESLWLSDRGPVDGLSGACLADVSAVGKHLVIALAPSDEKPCPRVAPWYLHVHLGMWGRWHRYRPGDRWSRAPSDARVRLGVAGAEWVCFRAARAELLRRVDLETHPSITHLGPDLLDHRFDLERIVARAAATESGTVSDLLLDQRVACGIGNVYRNEILFLEGLPPTTPVSALDDDGLRRLYRRARTLMRANLGGWRRTTTRAVSRAKPLRLGEPRSWVYNRTGRPCLRCRTPIRATRLGDQARATYWCPRCQAGRFRLP